ncbi:glycosyltransferase family A protein [Rathayibacter sp. YIM 133350]|uniref:glycosyltransferase family A protein n=1 Tax=Rathayibacter sp. YIM 133350 TaxID=3131992 RepID=UPI00307D7B87
MPSVSVVIPALNDADMLRRCLAALRDQLLLPDEVIVVDNGSTDDTAQVATDAGARVILEPVRGIWPAAAAGYDAASCDIIARLDADSVPPVDWLAHIEAEFVTTPEIDALTGPGDFYDGNPILAWLGEALYIGGYFWSMSIWLGHPPLFGSNFAMRRELWWRVRSQVHRELREVHDDLDLSLHLGPEVIVAFDDTLRVGISARPFSTWHGFSRRIEWAFGTLGMHLPEATPWRRRAARKEYEEERGIAGFTSAGP